VFCGCEVEERHGKGNLCLLWQFCNTGDYMKGNSSFSFYRNAFWVLFICLVTILATIFFVEKLPLFYGGRLLIPGLAPVLIPFIALFFIFPAIMLTHLVSETLISRFTSHWLNQYFQKYSILFTFLFSAIMVFGIFGRILAAKWGIIDDHEIMLFLGRDGNLHLSEIFSSLKLTEVGNFGSLTRYRPFYYMFRLMECVVWGANPVYWYAFRLVLLTLAVGLFWNLVALQIGWLGGGLLSAYTLTFFFWVDIVGALGPGETYAVLGLPIYIWGLVSAFQENHTKSKYVLSGLAIFLGSVACIGSKENFVLLFIPSAYMAFRALKLRKYLLFIFASGSVLFSLYVGIAVMILISQTGADVYAKSVSPLVRLNALFSIPALAPVALLGCLMIALGCLAFVRRISTGTKKTLFQAVFWLTVLCFVYFSQLVFYNGDWPTDIRYDFPGMLYVPSAIYILCLVAEKISSEIPHLKYPQFVVRFGWMAALALFAFSRGYAPITAALEKKIEVSHNFTNRIEQVSFLLKQNPENALVLESGNVWDYEPVFSYERFLRAYGVENPIFLRIHGYSPEIVTAGLEQSLAASLLDISNHGNNLFQPLSQIENYNGRCFSLNLSGSFETECQTIP